jgi:16S rRNA (guanine527-N7)-methyltransferase
MPDLVGFRELLSREFAPYGRLSESQLDQLAAHYTLLERWNARMNLTRIRHLDDVVRLHYCESLFLGTLLPPGPLSIADIGSGAGFPGLPLAVSRPEIRLALVESNQRKAVFLREAAYRLPNVRIRASRAESVEERFDWVVSRAVSPVDVIDLRLARNVALLISQKDASQLSGWEIHVIPWGHGRVAALKHSCI